jgi:hypothetical protein
MGELLQLVTLPILSFAKLYDMLSTVMVCFYGFFLRTEGVVKDHFLEELKPL